MFNRVFDIGFSLMEYLYLDIETTGINPDESEITLIGTMDKNGIKQYSFQEDLRLVCDKINSDYDVFGVVPTIVTYNGYAFDIPFLEKKLGLEINNEHIDLYLTAKEKLGKYNKYFSKDSIARFSEIYVPSNITGGRCAFIGNRSIEIDKPEMLMKVYQHNALDLITTRQLHLQMIEDEIL